jgi:hypothetical protein
VRAERVPQDVDAGRHARAVRRRLKAIAGGTEQ